MLSFEGESNDEQWSHEENSFGKRVTLFVVHVNDWSASKRACLVMWTSFCCSSKINDGVSNFLTSLERIIYH